MNGVVGVVVIKAVVVHAVVASVLIALREGLVVIVRGIEDFVETTSVASFPLWFFGRVMMSSAIIRTFTSWSFARASERVRLIVAVIKERVGMRMIRIVIFALIVGTIISRLVVRLHEVVVILKKVVRVKLLSLVEGLRFVEVGLIIMARIRSRI